MVQLVRNFSVVLVMMVLVAACNHMEPVYNVDSEAVPKAAQQKLSAEQVGNIIAKAALSKGWTVDKTEPGLLHLTLRWNNHSAQAGVKTAVSCLEDCAPEAFTSAANITYTKQHYSIEIDPAQNVNQSDSVTYRRYNQYIRKLQSQIEKDLSSAGFN